MNILHVLLHKVLGLVAGFLNVIIAAAVLPAATSFHYLTILSASQVFMAFAGFGISHKLVLLPAEEAQRQRSWPWFLLTFVMGCLFFNYLNKDPTAINLWPTTFFVSGLFLLIILAEWLRVAVARQIGFIIYNITLIIAASTIFVSKSIPIWLGILPILGSFLLLWAGRNFYTIYGEHIRPKMEDIYRTFRVASVNQYYNFIVLLCSLTGLGPESLVVVLIFRFAIFYNWQNFFWLRFSHKELSQPIEKKHRMNNLRFVRVNFLALFGTIAVAILAQIFDLYRYVPSGAFDREFALLLLYFAALRTVINLIFPYEVFLLYSANLRTNVLFLIFSSLSLMIIAYIMWLSKNPFTIITCVEINWIIWRFLSKRIIQNER